MIIRTIVVAITAMMTQTQRISMAVKLGKMVKADLMSSIITRNNSIVLTGISDLPVDVIA
jgi:hypothetical protein